MFTKNFFKLFPPPKYINIPYAGIDINDESIRCLQYSEGLHGYKIDKYGFRLLNNGIIEDGYIKDKNSLIENLSSLSKELKISIARASLPEERMYLFKTEVPDVNKDQIRKNIEFKLEENVPLSNADAIFFFELLPKTSDKLYASVSVAPRDLIESYLEIFKTADITIVSFEITAKALSRSVVDQQNKNPVMLINIMSKKTGIYIVNQGVVCFTSTIPWGNDLIGDKNNKDISDEIFLLRSHIEKIFSYWSEHGDDVDIKSIIVSGRNAKYISQISNISPNPNISLELADVWTNSFFAEDYIPKISLDDSLEYAITAGLALP